MSDFDRSVFWPAFKDAGMLRPALVKQTGRPAVTVYVDYSQPSEGRFGGAALSQEHVIQYQHADLPYLAESDPVSMLDADGNVIRAERFKVREAPRVTDNETEDRSGYFRYALLTRIV